MSPALAMVPSASRTAARAGVGGRWLAGASRSVRARVLSSATRSRVGASSMLSHAGGAVGGPGGVAPGRRRWRGRRRGRGRGRRRSRARRGRRRGRARVAAASAGSLNRRTSVRVTAPAVVAMSRRTPPAPIAASCRSSPIRRTLPPRSVMKSTAAARSGVSAMPASSMTTRVFGSMACDPAGVAVVGVEGPGELGQGVGRCPPTASAQLVGGDGGGGEADDRCRRRRARRWARTSMAVVLPEPAGASASWSRAPEVAISRTMAACPALRVTPLAVDSASAIPTRTSTDPSPAALLGGRDQARFGARRSRRRCTAATPCDGVDRGAVRRGSARRGTPRGRRAGPGPRRRSSARGSRSSTTSDGGRVQVVEADAGGPDPPLGLGADVPDLPGGAVACDGRDHLLRRSRATHRGGDLLAVAAPRPSAAATIAGDRVGRPEDLHGLAPPGWRAARPRCAGRAWPAGSPGWPAGRAASDSTGVGGRPCVAWNSTASSRRRASIAADAARPAPVQAGSTPTISRTGRFPSRCGSADLGARTAPRAARSARPRAGCCRSPRR